MDSLVNSTLINYLTVALGLGFVIFIHELGHFLLAKWNRVKVEMFALGFGPALVSWRKGLGLRLGSTTPEYRRWLAEHAEHQAGAVGAGEALPPAVGETEYSLRMVPLGGFVKMLGEGEEADREAAKTTDPRAYPNKPVGGRMAIISAGVIMNAIFGVICFAVAYGRGGLPVVPARIGGVVAGHPAYEAGLRTGDTVLAVDGRRKLDFLTLKRITAMSGSDQVLHLELDRPGARGPITVDVEPRRMGDADMKTMGILPPPGLALGRDPFIVPAGLDTRPGTVGALKGGDRVVAAGPEGSEPQPVADAFQLHDLMARYRDRPLVVVVEHGNQPGSKVHVPAAKRERITLPVVPFVDFGFRLAMGPVVSIQPGSPAAAAGFRPGDRIVGVEGIEPLDPMRLPDALYDRAGQPVPIRVARSEGGKPEEVVTLTATPQAASTWTEPLVGNEAMEVAPLGLAYRVDPKLAEVRPGSPAAAAKLKPGDVIRSVTLVYPAEGRQPEEAVTVDLDGHDASWPSTFAALQALPRNELVFRVNDAKEPVRLTPAPVPGWHHPLRGLRLQTDSMPLPPLSIPAAVRRGLDDTRDTILSVYAMVRSLFLGLISPKALGGPLMIADLASQTARAGLVSFLQFLGMLSLNLAVINFLPIPPLDGGQMAFLIAEKVRGRPLPEKALNAGTILGLVFVLGLMVFVLFQDVMRYLV